MNIIFTDHALNRVERRKIVKGEVLEANKYPDKVIKKDKKYSRY
ncbi:MAG TPA: hypothetical protein VJH37_04215 [Candidatus Nanoarchaeia archaeon]|nr:hypothetical protein [Candidatus Nanoarchaeia archaeon]